MRLLPGDAQEKNPWGGFLKQEKEWKHRSKVNQTLAPFPSSLTLLKARQELKKGQSAAP